MSGSGVLPEIVATTESVVDIIAQELFENDSHFTSAFGVMNKMRECEHLCDTTVQVIENTGHSYGTASVVVVRKVRAHRLVLSAAMPYFRVLFSTMPNEMKEQNMNVITLNDIDIHSLKLLVDYAYTGRIAITEENVRSLLLAANRLQVLSVSDACHQFLTKQLKPSNCLSIHCFAVQQALEELAKTAHKYSLKFFTLVVLTKDFLLLSFTEVLNIISNNELNARNEELVYNGVINWIKHDLEERERHLEKLLPHVRLPLMDGRVLALNVAEEPLIATNIICNRLLTEAMAHHLCPKESQDKRTVRTTQRISIGLKPYIFAIGGKYSSKYHKECEYYSPGSNQWLNFAPTSEMRRKAGVAALDGRIYAIGGRNGSGGWSSAESYDPLTNKWTNIKDMNGKRCSLGVEALNGCIYAAGGYNAEYLKCVEKYDPLVDIWSPIQAMQTQRHGFSLTALNGCLYAVGGGNQTDHLSSVERLDPREGKWHSMPDMSSPREFCSSATLDQLLYVVGGYSVIAMETGERFDPVMNRWEMITSQPHKLYGHNLVECEGRLYVIGGQDLNSGLDSVLSYNAVTEEWTPMSSMKLKRCYVSAAVLNCPELERLTN